MWAVLVEVDAPSGDQIADMAQAIDQVLIQTFVSHASIEALDEIILHRLTRRDVVLIDLAVFLPFQGRRSEAKLLG